jgi:hypothetical protein
MKSLLVVLGILAGTAVLGGSAQAQNYPWCAIYSAFGARNCGFATFEQCQENLRGIGGVCNPNAMYEPPAGPHPHIRKSHTNS